MIVDGIRVHVSEAGSGDPVVLLHGWGASHKVWNWTAPALAARHRVIAFDWPGCGDSDKPKAPYTIEWFAGFLPKLLDALGLGPVALAGHSMGGAIAAAFALEHPDRVSRLVLVNALCQGRTAFPFRTKLLTLPGIRRVGFWLMAFRWFRRFVTKDFAVLIRLSDDLVDDLKRGTFRSLMRPIKSMRSTDLEPRFPELRVPTLVVNSDADAVLKPSQLEIQRRIPGARAEVFPGVGHFPMLERTEEFNRLVGEFLAAVREEPSAIGNQQSPADC